MLVDFNDLSDAFFKTIKVLDIEVHSAFLYQRWGKIVMIKQKIVNAHLVKVEFFCDLTDSGKPKLSLDVIFILVEGFLEVVLPLFLCLLALHKRFLPKTQLLLE